MELWWLWLILGVILFVGISVAGGASKHFYDSLKKKDKVMSSIGLTAADFARDVLHKKHINVTVVRTDGEYNDYYSSKNKEIAISETLYLSPTVVALGVTAHEIGHAITDNKNSITFRTHQILGKASRFLNNLVWLFLLAALAIFLFVSNWQDIPMYLLYSVLGIIILSFIFKFITVTNERIASNIGLSLLKEYGMSHNEIKIVKKIYTAALLTYIGSIFMPFVKILNFLGSLFYNTIGRLFR